MAMNARLEELRSKFQENPRRYFAPFANELRKAGDSAQAISVCRTHLAGQPGHVSGHIVLGQALYEAGETVEARDIFTASLELDPENLIALRSLGEIAQVNGQFAIARQWYERLLDADPRNTEVSQLLKDIPTEAGNRSSPPEAAASETAYEEALPDGAKSEPEPEPVKYFHTSFSGSGPAYKSEEDAVSEAPVNAESSRFAPPAPAEPDFEIHVEHTPVAKDASTESLDVLDDAFTLAAPGEDVQVEAPPPDEPYDGPSVVRTFEVASEPATLEAAEVEFEIPGDVRMGESVVEGQDDDLPPTPIAEAPRALFAEHGFEGPADDQIGWMTTPSAALSDLESAPENWFDEEAAESEEPVPASEARAEEIPSVEMNAAESDSWFDEVDGASVIESTAVSTEEFWLPPELPQIPAAAAQVIESEPEPHEEVVVSAEMPDVVGFPDLAEVAETMAMASAESDIDEIESERLPFAAMSEDIDQTEDIGQSDDIDQSVISESPAETPFALGWQEPAEAEPVQAAQWTEPVEAESEPSTWAESAEPESAETPRWSEPVEPEPVEAVQAAEHETTDFGEDADSPIEESHESEPAFAENVIGRTPGFIDAVSTPPPAPFVTETLAELYLQQGFRDEALAIYRQLLERDSSDETIRLRIQAIEKGEVSDVVQSTDAPVETRAASQSVRTFFSRLARRPAVAGTTASTPTPSGSSGNDPEVPFAAAASALANLFSASKPPAADEGAAATLATAYTDPAGRPSRADDRELSLDHLFRDVPPVGPSEGVTLDEFYSTPSAPPGSPTEPGESGSTEPGGTDIRQFTAWLEGLRKK